MKTIGIIAEYNPFHNGHRYQIEQIKKQTLAENIVIVMSGDFVQRGTPAFTDKYLRTQMALSCGADFVFELPVSFSCASAEYFAGGAISLLTSLGFVDGLCFGAECEDLSILKKAADILGTPSKDFESAIHSLVSQGISYPKAREQALRQSCPELFYGSSSHEISFQDSANKISFQNFARRTSFQNSASKASVQNFSDSGIPEEIPDGMMEKTTGFFSSPNNILAIEYLKALSLNSSHLEPVLIKRAGAGYHETELKKDTSYASASAIRSLFYSKKYADALDSVSDYIPEPVRKILEENPYRCPVHADDFSALLYYRLLKLTGNDLDVLDMNEDIYHRMKNLRNQFESVSTFTEELKTKQYTYSRISRILFHLLLDIKSPLPVRVPYARLLGFRREKSSLLRRIRRIPLITKPADGFKQLSADRDACALYEKDVFAASLYRQIQIQKQPGTNHKSITMSKTECREGPVQA